MYKEKRNILLTALLFLQIILVRVLSGYPEFIEKHYSLGIYPGIAKFSRMALGKIPFSVGDIFYAVLVILIFRFAYQLIKSGERWKKLWSFTAICSILYFLFYSLWGLNYSRLPLQEKLSLDREQYELSTLKAFTERMVLKTDSLHGTLSVHDSIPVEVPYSKNEIIKLAAEGFEELALIFPEYAYENPSIKKSLFSLPLTYMGFSGYLNPITGEAHVDALIPKVDMPLTASHEIAHQLGIGPENEANFIGFLGAYYHSDPYFNYAAHLFALRYALVDIHRSDKALFEEYLQALPEGVVRNMRESNEFWRRYENPLEPLFKIFYDNYLKYNQQHDGLQSYSKVLELLISYDLEYPLEIN